MLDIKTGAGKHSNLFSRMHGPDNCLPGVTRCSVCPPGVLSSVSIASSWSIVHPFPLLCLSVCFLLCTLRFPTASKAQGGLTAPPCSYSLVVESLFVAFILGLHSAFWPIFLNNSTSVLLWVSLPWGLAPWGCFSCVSLIFILFGPVLGLLTDSWLNSVELCLNQKQVSYPRFSTFPAAGMLPGQWQGSWACRVLARGAGLGSSHRQGGWEETHGAPVGVLGRWALTALRWPQQEACDLETLPYSTETTAGLRAEPRAESCWIMFSECFICAQDYSFFLVGCFKYRPWDYCV